MSLSEHFSMGKGTAALLAGSVVLNLSLLFNRPAQDHRHYLSPSLLPNIFIVPSSPDSGYEELPAPSGESFDSLPYESLEPIPQTPDFPKPTPADPEVPDLFHDSVQKPKFHRYSPHGSHGITPRPDVDELDGSVVPEAPREGFRREAEEEVPKPEKKRPFRRRPQYGRMVVADLG